ncbi:MAG: hypothetical protein BRD44_02855 [Bacteroidetes bacterium QS_7_67_15]|nr:MAG: hypothetical protein BRD44_02855 [Bacteroidetes bacterium QS_7_67_15]
MVSRLRPRFAQLYQFDASDPIWTAFTKRSKCLGFEVYCNALAPGCKSIAFRAHKAFPASGE